MQHQSFLRNKTTFFIVTVVIALSWPKISSDFHGWHSNVCYRSTLGTFRSLKKNFWETFLCFSPQQLLREIENKEHKADREQELEITWEPGLREATEELVANKIKEKEKKKMAPWEIYLQNKKEKRKEKRMEKESLKKRYVQIVMVIFFLYQYNTFWHNSIVVVCTLYCDVIGYHRNRKAN